MKRLFENGFHKAIETPEGRKALVHTLVVSNLIISMQGTRKAISKYGIRIEKYYKHPSEVKHVNENEKIFHTQFNKIKLQIIQRAKPHNPNKLSRIKEDYTKMVNNYIQKLAGKEAPSKLTL